MAQVVTPLDQPSSYRDNRSEIDRETERRLLAQSSTLYVGNLSFYTTEAQMYELFSTCSRPEEGGGVKRIIMGLDRNQKQFGRGKSGGQVRDEFRQEYDSGREKRRQEQERLRSQIQFDTYAAVGGLGMAGADVPRGEESERDRQKRDRSEDEDIERRDDEKRLRGEKDDE
ncbi:uncharacterized protein I206_104079 [Kwoniella pini CBS 10737]|uniref:Nuclear cap-binding protein subunit 2 n=1 Tax=Kwoniella pini CBS 10737 TaxID=1296096 RepID=A0AAJ8MQX6_9TREE